MDVGCLDLGCISVLDKNTGHTVLDSVNKECDSSEKVSSGSKPGKKPSHRKNSPINWFPRKKGDSYLQRKIKMLQELDGMSMTLDEALGDSNPHYSRVLREKIAAREAANKAVEARKAALVEASWCRILKAARIQSKEAEELLLKAEKTAAEAFEAAKAMEVIMFDVPNSPHVSCQVQTSTVSGGGSTPCTVTTSFEVDKQVAAAVKTAFTRLANCPTSNKEEFKDLLRKINQNPDLDDSNSDFSECELESGSEFEPLSQDMDFKLPPIPGTRLKKYKRRQSLDTLSMTTLVDMMFERLRCLNEDELSSLATIVATCGLNAALAEVGNSKVHGPGSAADYTSSEAVNRPRRMSSVGSAVRRNEVQLELPSLDKFLVKHVSKLEREVQEAKDRRKNELKEGDQGNTHKSGDGKVNLDGKKTSSESDDLETILVKHSSKLEKEIEEAKKNTRKSFKIISKKPASDLTISEGTSDLGSILIKHPSKLEKEVQEIRKNSGKMFDIDGKELGRAPNFPRKYVPEVPSLDKILVKHVSRLEKEVQEAKNRKKNESDEEARLEKENVNLNKEENGNGLETEKTQSNCGNYRHQNKFGGNTTADCEGLDSVLVKHISRLEKEKMALSLNQEEMHVERSGRKAHMQTNEGGLDQILVKHKSRFEREKMAPAQQSGEEEPPRLSVSRREARERELQEAWGRVEFRKFHPPTSLRLERDKAAWIKAEEEARRRAMEEEV
ncbi:hypothetical protein OIU84_025238 [Salix udensis]|uniref:Uncharacterized protein n=1 Tax=Salix udensis TaxID=889485 RepID=A0AAD6PC72_9ROSI|nr:hypothetical protein OIU84_025238 [Salix udensis]